jgi:hypothetical protein
LDGGGAAALFGAEFANGEFSEAEKKKIMANERLAEIALTDPKRVKRCVHFFIYIVKKRSLSPSLKLKHRDSFNYTGFWRIASLRQGQRSAR